MRCKMCHQVESNASGKTCKACGMVLNDMGKVFCSRMCRLVYNKNGGVTY